MDPVHTVTVLYMETVVFHIGDGAVQLHKLVILLCAITAQLISPWQYNHVIQRS